MSNFTQFLGGGSIQTWVSGSTVTKFDYRKSPTDGEIYQRVTATGSGTTDPADDSTNYVAASFQRMGLMAESTPITSVGGNAGNIAGCTSVSITTTVNAGVRTKILAATGRGNCGFFALVPVVAAGTTNRIEIIADGRSVYDYTQTVGAASSPYIAQVPIGGLAVRNAASFFYSAIADANTIRFRRTFDVWVTPSVAITAASGSNFYHTVRGDA